MTWKAYEMDARREGCAEGHAEGRAEGRAEGIIKSGRRHKFRDEVIIEDIMAETGCGAAEARKMLQRYEQAKEKALM